MATEKITAGNEGMLMQAMGQATDVAEEITRLFAGLKLPAVPDVEALLTAYKRNVEALAAVNRVALESSQAVAKRHMELVQQAMSELSETILSLATVTDTPQAKAAKQTALMKKAYEAAISNTRELGTLIRHANTEAMDLIHHRFSAALDEVRFLTAKPANDKA
jgi:phasin family protein